MTDNDKYIEDLKEARKRAIAERDGIAYIQTTEALGLDLNEVPGLANDGYDLMAIEQNKSGNIGNLEKISVENLENPVLEGLKQVYDIVNRSFPELQSGENRSPIEIKQRIKELEQAGWPVKPYKKMNLKPVSIYFNQLHKKINKTYKEKISGSGFLF